MATLLTNIQSCFLELGLPSPNSAVSSYDTSTLQVLALMNRLGTLLLTERNWSVLAKDYRFQTVFYTYTGDLVAGSSTINNLSSNTGLSSDFMLSGTGINSDTFLTSVATTTAVMSQPATQTGTGVTLIFGQAKYAMPSDFERIVNKTQYNKTNRWAVLGPKSAQEWQTLKNSFITSGPRQRFRIQNNKFEIYPMPTSVMTLGFEYISNGWVTSSAGVSKSRFTADDDTSVFPDNLLVTGTKLKFFEIKGFDTTTLLQDFTRELAKWAAAEAGSDTLSLAPSFNDGLLTTRNIPDTGYGV